MRRIVWAVLALLLGGVSSALAVPNALNYQGQLFLNGNPTAGAMSITSRMYPAPTGGTELWTETDIVTVTAGLFSTTLGDGVSFPAGLFSSQVPWLEMEVNGTTLTPRTRFQSVPYALSAPATGGNELWETDGTSVTPVGGRTIKLDNGKALVWRDAGNSTDVGVIQFDDANKLHFRPGAQEQMTITSDGNVGIGAPNPSSNLDLRGRFRVTADAPSPDRWSVAIGDGTGWKSHFTKNDGTKLVTFQDNGHIGIGTSTPSSISWFGDPALVVTGVRPTLSLATNTAGGLGTIQFAGPQSQFHVNYGDAPTPFVDLGANFRIYGNGAVGIGTQAPEATLHVAGDARVNNLWARGDVDITRPGGSGFTVQTPSSDVRLFSQANVPVHIGTNGDAFKLTIMPNGAVNIPGNLTVNGTKCRAVEGTPFGTLYYHAVESAHPLFSIGGESKLQSGMCTIELDPKWLAGVTIDERHPMQVWITFYGPHGEYYIERQLTGFTVREASGASAAFGWRVEARQKGYEDVYLNRVGQTAAR